MELKDLSTEELVTLGLLAGMSKYDVFNRKKDMVKLAKLMFLASYADIDENGNIILGKRKINIKFKIYLFGIIASELYNILKRLKSKGILEQVDIGIYSLKENREQVFDKVIKELKSRNPRLAKNIELIINRYGNMETHELSGIVNSLLGLTSPEIKAIFYGIDVDKLIEASRSIREMSARGEIIID